MIDWKETILTGGTDEFINPANPKLGSQVSVAIKIHKNNPIDYLFIRIAPNGEEINLEMKKSFEDDFFSHYQVSFPVITKITTYRFGIVTPDEFFWFNNELKLTRSTSSYNHDFKLIADFDDPAWIKESIFYQIFPDRFFDGDPTNNVKTGEYSWHGKLSVARDWNDTERLGGDYPSIDFYGGDLEGIRQKISYFKEQGISSLNLNPIFHAPSNHKYDIIDYKTIDKHFGSNEEFSRLVAELHEQGIRIILDGVFNHTGEGHIWFNKLNVFENQNGAFNSPDSPYSDFYIFENWPDNYISWMGYKSLPKLNYKSEKLRHEMYKKEDSVIKYWLSKPFNIDGWRIDVANMLGRQDESQLHSEIWEEIRTETKKCKPDAYLMGEHFFDGTPLLDGKKLDAVMNYQGFSFPLIKWLTKKEIVYISTPTKKNRNFTPIKFEVQDFTNQLENFRSLLPFQLQLLSFNLLGSHDVPRFLTRLEGNVQLYKIAIIFLLTYIGVPSIYYGDEIGMQGSFDPDNRKPMIWNKEKWNNEILQFYKSMIKLRNTKEELKKGLIKNLYSEDEVYCFARVLDKAFTIIVLNNNKNTCNISLPVWKIGILNKRLNNYFENQEIIVTNGFLKLHLQNYECAVLTDAF